jgi:hypothetical protein
VGPFIFSLFLIMNPPDLSSELPRGFYPTEQVTQLQKYDRGIYPAERPVKLYDFNVERMGRDVYPVD